MQKSTAVALRDEMNAAIQGILTKHGVTLHKANVSYGGGEANITFKVKSADSEEAENNFRSFAKMMGCEPEWYGAEVIIQGDRFKVVGINTRAPKNCIEIIKLSTGKPHRCQPATIRRAYVAPKVSIAELKAKEPSRGGAFA